jgi:hypothetical protein
VRPWRLRTAGALLGGARLRRIEAAWPAQRLVAEAVAAMAALRGLKEAEVAVAGGERELSEGGARESTGR